MDDTTWELALDVVARVERAVQSRDCPAIVALAGDRRLVMSDYDYLRDRESAERFERRAAARAQEIHAVRWAFAVPQVWVVTDDHVLTRAVSNHPLRPGETECITLVTFHIDEGIDFGRVPYTRRPDTEPVFGDPEWFEFPLTASADAPARTLLRLMLDPHDDAAPGST